MIDSEGFRIVFTREREREREKNIDFDFVRSASVTNLWLMSRQAKDTTKLPKLSKQNNKVS